MTFSSRGVARLALLLVAAGLSGGTGEAAALPPRAVLRSCDLIAKAIGGIAGAKIARSSEALPESVRGSSPAGCLVTMKSSFKDLGPGLSLDERISRALVGHGFAAVSDYDADGPDGTRFGFRKDAIVCIVSESWEGGDDTDPAYVPDDAFELEVGCSEDRGPARGRPE